MDKFSAILDLFRKGKEVASVEKWKQHQITGNAVGALLLAIVAILKVFFNVALPISDELALMIGGVIVAAVNMALTAMTSTRAGILPAKEESVAVKEQAKAALEAVADKVEDVVVDKVKEAIDNNKYLG